MTKFLDFLCKKWISVLCIVLLLASTVSLYFISFIGGSAAKGVFTFIMALVQTVSLIVLSVPVLRKKN